jgi:hypothetical protein
MWGLGSQYSTAGIWAVWAGGVPSLSGWRFQKLEQWTLPPVAAPASVHPSGLHALGIPITGTAAG